MKDENALAKVTMDKGGVALRNMDDARTMCHMIHKSNLAPKALDTPEKIFVALQTGAEAGLTPLTSLRSVDVIQGLPSWKGQAALALIRSAGHAIDVWAEGEGAKRQGCCGFKRDGKDVVISFSLEDAKRAGLGGQNYSKYPDDMLIWRAVARAGKRYFSDVLMGMDVGEVVREYAPVVAVQDEPAQLPPPPETDPLLDDSDPQEPVDEPTGGEQPRLI